MDVFYYWRDYDADLKAGRIGWLVLSRATGIPTGSGPSAGPRTGRTHCSCSPACAGTDAPTTKLPIEKGTPAISTHDPAGSVRFSNADEDAKITEMTSLIRARFPNAFLANFRGDAGVQPMEADLLAQLVPRLAAYSAEPFPTPEVTRRPRRRGQAYTL